MKQYKDDEDGIVSRIMGDQKAMEVTLSSGQVVLFYRNEAGKLAFAEKPKT